MPTLMLNLCILYYYTSQTAIATNHIPSQKVHNSCYSLNKSHKPHTNSATTITECEILYVDMNEVFLDTYFGKYLQTVNTLKHVNFTGYT